MNSLCISGVFVNLYIDQNKPSFSVSVLSADMCMHADIAKLTNSCMLLRCQRLAQICTVWCTA